MRGLVIDTALGALSVAAFDGETTLAGRRELMSKGHQERLGGLVRAVVAESGGFDALERIAVTVGPGSFTGLRVGLAFALGLGAALQRPVVGVTTLEALAASIDAAGPMLAAVDARRGEVYAQAFQDGCPLEHPAALRLDDLPEPSRMFAPCRLVGSGAPLLADAFPGAEALDLPAPTLDGLVRAAIAAERPARPLYLRAPDAAVPTRRPGQTRPGREGGP